MILPELRPQQLAATVGWSIVSVLLIAPLLSVAFSPAIPWATKGVLGAFCVLACVRPSSALLIMTALVGLGGFLSSMAGVPALRTIEFLVIASLAGCSIRAISAASPFRRALAEQISAPLALLTVTALASALVWLRVHQAESAYPWTYVEGLLGFLFHDFFVGQGEFRLLVTMAVVVEGLALYLVVCALCRVDMEFFPRALRMLVVGGAGVGILSVVRLTEVQLRNPGAIEALRGR